MGDEQHMVKFLYIFRNKYVIYFFTIAYAAAIFLMSQQSELPGGPSGWRIENIDKLQHAILYLGFGLLVFASSSHIFSVMGSQVLTGFNVGISYAILDELHQSFVPGRNPALGDLAADIIGISLAFIIWFYLLSEANSRK